MKLSHIELENPVWLRIRTELEARLNSLREQNDIDKTQDETAKIRGRIAEIKLILNWAKSDPKIM